MNNSTNVTTAAIGAALGSIVVWVLALCGVDTPPEAQAAIVVLATAGLTYLVPTRKAKEPGAHSA